MFDLLHSDLMLLLRSFVHFGFGVLVEGLGRPGFFLLIADMGSLDSPVFLRSFARVDLSFFFLMFGHPGLFLLPQSFGRPESTASVFGLS